MNEESKANMLLLQEKDMEIQELKEKIAVQNQELEKARAPEPSVSEFAEGPADSTGFDATEFALPFAETSIFSLMNHEESETVGQFMQDTATGDAKRENGRPESVIPSIQVIYV